MKKASMQCHLSFGQKVTKEALKAKRGTIGSMSRTQF